MTAGADRVEPLWTVRLFTAGSDTGCPGLIPDHVLRDGTARAPAVVAPPPDRRV